MPAKTVKRGQGPLFYINTFIAAMILLPSLMLVFRLLGPPGESWAHIREYLLFDYVKNSLVLILFTGLATGILGTYLAWNLSRYEWKIGRLLEILLCLPMAIPTYIAGYVYGGILTPFGTLDRLLDRLDISSIRIDILSIGGAVFVFSLFLTPYVLLVTRGFFDRMPRNIEESSKLLGKSSLETFTSIILPMARSAIVGGVVLVILEVLNDYGLVKYFGIPTFSTAIYTTWFGLSDVDGAIRLASGLMSIVVIVLLLEQVSRGRRKTSQARALADRGSRKKPGKWIRVIFYTISSLYLLLALIIPLLQLASWSLMAKNSVVMRNFGTILANTLVVALLVTFMVILSGILIGNMNRINSTRLSRTYGRLVILGYSVPASIIAIAVLVFFISIDRSLAGLYETIGLRKLFLAGSSSMLIFALVIRFMAIGFNSIDAGMSKIGKKHYEASKLLGKDDLTTFMKVDFPMLKTSIMGASILTFIDVLKELPLTLILRPFNFETLATRVYTYAGDEMIQESSVYSLIIIAVSTTCLAGLTLLRSRKVKKENVL